MDDWIEGYDTNGVLVFLVIALLPSLIAVLRLLRFPTPTFLERWFAHHDVEPTSESIEIVSRSLRRTKQIRTVGFVLGYSGLQLGWVLYTRDARRSGELPFITLLLAVWSLTVVVAALWATPASAGTATRVERHLDQYRPAFGRFDRQLLVAALLTLTVGGFVFPGEKDGTTIDGWLALGRTVPALAVMGVVWAAQRVIVARHQSQPTLELIRVDDALRSISVSALAGLGYGIPLLAIGSVFWQLAVVHEPAGLLMLAVVLTSSMLSMFGLTSIIGFGGLGNELVIFRHRLRTASDLEPESPPSDAVAG